MTEQTKISPIAVVSLVLGLLILIPLIPAVLAIIVGIVARRHIHRSEGRYVGKGLATGGIILGVLMSLCWIFVLFSGTTYRVGQNEVAVISRFGKIQKTVQPGLHFKMPVIDKANIVPVRGFFEWKSAALDYVTSDGHRVTLRAAMRYRICDPERYLIMGGLGDRRMWENRLEEFFYAHIMHEANNLPLDEFVLSVRNLTLQKTLHGNFNTKLRSFGICMHEVDMPYEVLKTSLD
ncbi:MAG: DUF4190 domain-containing protein [Desulfobacterales bacterium]|nr:MAG: DUF4190 domain-containing protein [Desulfobacterales bacterium]